MSPEHKSASDLKEIVRQEWTGAAPSWQKWNRQFVIQTRAATELILRGAELASGMHVLDLACGTGEPAIGAAKAVGPMGRVVATDLVPGMLEAASKNARAQGLANMEFRVADAEQLPFATAEFDRITCRFGIMFFPDMPRALASMKRVLKAGGRISFLAFASLEENPLFSATLRPFLSRAPQPPPPPPDAPNVFRFADPAKLAGVLSAAGFHHLQVAKRQVPWPWPGPPEEAWESVREMAAPFKTMIEALPPDQREAANQEVLQGLRQFWDGKQVNASGTVVLATAAA